MNKTQFVRELQRELGDGVTPRQAERALDAVLDTIARSVLRRSLVKFRGFGSFSIKRRRARVYAIRKTAANCLCMNQAP